MDVVPDGKVLVDYEFLLKIAQKCDYQGKTIIDLEKRLEQAEKYIESRVQADEHSNNLIRELLNKQNIPNQWNLRL